MGKDKECKCHGRHGWKMLIAGIIVTINAYWPFMGWAKLIGVLLILGGLLKLVMPCKCK